MQSKWGPRIFWAVVFVMIALGIYVYFDDPADNIDQTKFGSIASTMVTINPKVRGCLIELGVKDRVGTDYQGKVKLSKGKILQFYPVQGDPKSTTTGTSFDGKSASTDTETVPLIYRLVYLVDGDETLTLNIGKDDFAIPIAELSGDQPKLLMNDNVRVRSQIARQIFENDSNTDDLYPQLTRDAQGNDYLLYMNASRNKGLDVEAIVTGSFETMESPIIGVTLKMSKCVDGVWQYSEPVTPKLETCLNPTIAVVPDGRIYVSWLQRAIEGWDIFYTFKDQGLTWSNPARFTTKSGSVQQLVSASDSKGRVWLAWQTWQEDHYDIFAAVLNDDKHLWRTPGLVAEHPRDLEGRWFPALAGDQQGNMYVAWSVFRQGAFDIEAMKLFDNMVKGKALLLASSSTTNKLRPSLTCDKENNLWVTYEESLLPGNFGDAILPASTIRVRTLRSDGSIDERPALPAVPVSDIKSTKPSRYAFPSIFFSSEGTPMVACQSNHTVMYSRWQEAGWTTPQALGDLSAKVLANAPATYQVGHVVNVHETIDHQGRLRLEFVAKAEATAASAIPRQSAPAVDNAESKWKPFAELARQFRKRSDDLVLSKRYLLRGLFVLPKSVKDFASDPWGMSALALEQGLYDWVMIPQEADAPHATIWLNGQQSLAQNQLSDRNFLLGYYRHVLGQREPLLLVDVKKNESPLMQLKDLEQYRRVSERGTKINVNEATDRTMLQQFLYQHHRIGFALNDNWKMMAALTQPGSYESDSLEKQLKPIWYPEETPNRPVHSALRVVAFANGKSNEQLIEALRERHYYMATDDIYLIVRSDRKLPGDIFQTSFKPSISVTVQGTGKLKAVEVWQDNKLVKTEAPPGQAAILEFVDEKVDTQWHSYTVKVIQENGAEAISQPMWIRSLQ